MKASKSKLNRQTFQTSRVLDFFSRRGLTAQTGHDEAQWPLVVLKELVDNALDACEEAGITPEIAVKVDELGITVSDNGPGILPQTITGVLDFGVKVSSREAYVSPTRGAQGNALKTIVAMPFALDGDTGRVTIRSGGIRHEITISVNQILQKPKIEHIEASDPTVKNGTSVQVHWPNSASSLLTDAKARFLPIACDYIFLNPHLTLQLEWLGPPVVIAGMQAKWPKWLPSYPTSPHWYTTERFERMIGAHLAHENEQRRSRTIREFLMEFSGLSSTKRRKKVLDEAGLARADMSIFEMATGILDRKRAAKLLEAMKANTNPVQPRALGVIGAEHLRIRFQDEGCDMNTFQYRTSAGTTNGLPWVIETAFAWRPEAEDRRLITGVNWSPGIWNPFRQIGKLEQSLDEILEQQRIGCHEPILFLLNLTCPLVTYTDHGKSSIVVGRGELEPRDARAEKSKAKHISEALVEAVTSATKRWCKVRKAEERDSSRVMRRREAMWRNSRVTVKHAAFEEMDAAYQRASSDGTLPAHARQVMYAARGVIQERTGRPLDDQYFCQTLLPDYLRDNPQTTSNWDVVFDARGHFIEPHTGLSVPLGTLNVRQYLDDVSKHQGNSDSEINVAFDRRSTCGPLHRYSAILFIEKEGFLPLFRAVRLAERFDIAIMSTKGLSVTASRTLVDQLCANYQIPLLVLHDFDKSGFSIVGTLQRSTRRFTFQNNIQVIDLGLRLQDIKDWNLQSEDVAYDSKVKVWPGTNLAENGATEEEIAFLCDEQKSNPNRYVGRRVELNAFTSRDLVTWIEKGLIAHGIKKLIPDVNTLETAFRQAVSGALVERRLEEVRRQAQRDAESVAVPLTLQAQIRDHLHDNPESPWDKGIATIATAAAHQFSA